MDKLKFIKDQMDILAVPYEFGEWTQDIQYPYFTGEMTEEPISTEDGAENSTFILTGFHRGKRIDLEEIKAKVKKHFDPIFGIRQRTAGGSIAAFFNNAYYVPTGEADLKRIEIYITIKEWKGA